MRREEKFVGTALVEFFGGPSSVSASEGEDPPDLYLTIGESRVGVEVTRLSQFTFEPEGTLGNRATQDSFGMRLIDNLNEKFGPSLPDGISLLVGLWVPISKVARFRKGLTAWVERIVAAPAGESQQEREIEGSKVSMSIIPERPSGKKIVGFVANTNSSADIGLNARLVLENRIYTKDGICSTLPKPIWLAVLNDYWLADADTYVAASQQIKLAHCFERIFLVSDEGSVSEITIKA